MLLNVEKIQNIKGFGLLKVFKNPMSYISALGLISFCISISLAITSIFYLNKICILCFWHIPCLMFIYSPSVLRVPMANTLDTIERVHIDGWE